MFAFKALLDANQKKIAEAISAEHGKTHADALGEVAARHRGGRVRCGIPHLLKGEFSRNVGPGDRHPLRPPAARRRRRHHAVQLPGHGADVDVPGGDRLRQHLHPQAVGARPLGVAGDLRAVPRGRRARRRVQRRPRRQGGGRRDPDPSRHQGGVLRRLDADRRLHLRDRHRARKARPGARRRQEPHDRHARRRHRQGGGRADGRGLRLGRRALHGDLGGGAGRRGDGEPAGREAGAEDAGAEDRAGDRPRGRDGAAGHQAAPRQGARLHRRRA